MMIFIRLLFAFYSSKLILSCGITTHIEIAHRAAFNYDYNLDSNITVSYLIKKYQSAFQAGNPYPDSYYPNICKNGTFNYVSEDTHWVPFLNATIKYIQKKYSKPYNEDGLRLITFMLGYISHQMADVTWHSLGVDQGFLSAMGFANFHGSFDQAHSVGDFGGDIVNQFELNTQYISDLGEWYIPYNDLYNIYYEYYGREIINKEVIIECSSLLFIGRLAEQIAVSLLYADYFKKSIFLTDKLNDYFLGGLDDMATWTQISWNKALYMLENGLDKCKLDHNILYVQCENMETKFPRLLRFSERNTNEVKLDLDKEFLKYFKYMKREISDKGLILKANKDYYDLLNNRSKLKQFVTVNDHDDRLNNFNLAPRSNTTYYILNDYSNLGWSILSADLNNDNLDDLIIGAPVYSLLNQHQTGAVFIVMADPSSGSVPLKNLNVEREANLIINAPQESISGRFGHSIVVLDINLDGFKDIVISAPSHGLTNITYEGRVYIYLGDSTHKYSSPDIIITCKEFKYCNLGWSLSIGDLNQDTLDDLIISSPYAATCGSQCGLVAVLFSNEKTFPSVIDVKSLDWIITGKMEYELFGHSTQARLGILIVGAPQSRICAEDNCETSKEDIQAVGRIYIYKFPDDFAFGTLIGKGENDQLGYSFDMGFQMGAPIIAVSSVTKDTRLENKTSFELNRAGIVELYKFNMVNGTFTWITTLKSDRPYSGFGSKVKFYSPLSSENQDIYIAAPMRSDEILLLDQVQDGIVYMFKGGSQIPIGNITDECSATDFIPCPAKKAYAIFQLSEKKSRFGFDFTFLATSNKNSFNIAISSVHSSYQNSRLSGKINIFNFDY